MRVKKERKGRRRKGSLAMVTRGQRVCKCEKASSARSTLSMRTDISRCIM